MVHKFLTADVKQAKVHMYVQHTQVHVLLTYCSSQQNIFQVCLFLVNTTYTLHCMGYMYAKKTVNNLEHYGPETKPSTG